MSTYHSNYLYFAASFCNCQRYTVGLSDLQGIQKNRTEYADEWYEDTGARGDIVFRVNLLLCVLNTPIQSQACQTSAGKTRTISIKPFIRNSRTFRMMFLRTPIVLGKFPHHCGTKNSFFYPLTYHWGELTDRGYTNSSAYTEELKDAIQPSGCLQA